MDEERVRENAERYFAALRRFDLEGVAECFTEDAFYSHPPYDSAVAERAEAVGRAAIVALLRTKRGPRSIVQEMRHCVVDGELAYLEGIAYQDGDGASTAPPTIWLSSARVVPDGRFRRYVSYTPGYPIGDTDNW